MGMDKDTKVNSVGKSFEELSAEEMLTAQGAGDIEGDTTPLTTVTTSSAACGAAIGGATGLILSKIIKK